MDDDSTRHAWLARRVDRDLRSRLQAALLWTDRALVGGTDEDSVEAARAAATVEGILRELREALTLVDELVALGCPAGSSETALWPRPIVVRDLMGAAVRLVSAELRTKKVEMEARTRPEELRLVADPDCVLQALTGLLRAGARSARPGEVIELEASLTDDPDRKVRFVLDAPRLSVGPASEVDALCRGLPPDTLDPRRWPAALPVAVAGRCARVLDGVLIVETTDDEGARATLLLPADRAPEHRPGWIP